LLAYALGDVRYLFSAFVLCGIDQLIHPLLEILHQLMILHDFIGGFEITGPVVSVSAAPA